MYTRSKRNTAHSCVRELLDISHLMLGYDVFIRKKKKNEVPSSISLLTTELLDISDSGICPTHPYPESFALKSLSICMLAVENSLYIACRYKTPSK